MSKRVFLLGKHRATLAGRHEPQGCRKMNEYSLVETYTLRKKFSLGVPVG